MIEIWEGAFGDLGRPFLWATSIVFALLGAWFLFVGIPYIRQAIGLE